MEKVTWYRYMWKYACAVDFTEKYYKKLSFVKGKHGEAKQHRRMLNRGKL